MTREAGGLPLFHEVLQPTQGSAPHPCLVVMHGMGSDEQQMLALASEFDPRVLVLSVRAPLQHPMGGYWWHDLEAEGPGLDGAGVKRSLDLLTTFVAGVPHRYNVVRSQICVAGFSMGAAMAGALALTQPELVSGAIMLGGYLPPPGQKAYNNARVSGKPFFQGHGLYDPTVSIAYARMTRDLLVSLRVDVAYHEYPIGHEVTGMQIRDAARWCRLMMPPA
jgi:phospholipase/carboxylesterase